MTSRDCYFYDWGGSGKLHTCDSYPRKMGARCAYFDEWFTRNTDGVLHPNCTTCNKYKNVKVIEEYINKLDKKREEYIKNLTK